MKLEVEEEHEEFIQDVFATCQNCGLVSAGGWSIWYELSGEQQTQFIALCQQLLVWSKGLEHEI